MAEYCTTLRAVAWSLLVLAPFALGQQESCYATDNNPYLYFGTKTTYENIRNPQGIPKVPGCRPVQVWMVGRHGAHWTNPGETSTNVNLMDMRDQILTNHELGRGSLCPEDLSRLRNWREHLVSSREKDSLTPQGLKDTYSLGLRVRQSLPELFENTIPSQDFQFYHTEMGKTKDTAVYFAKGLFGFVYNPTFTDGLNHTQLLEGFASCQAWSHKNLGIQEKVEMFTKGSPLHEVYSNISRRLGFNYDLPFYAVDAMYQWCTRDKSTSLEDPAPWCCAFSPTELKVMEFLDDLKYHYKTGPGGLSSINKKLGCPLARDMLMRFKETQTNPDTPRPRGVFHFGDAENVGLLASWLGLFGERNLKTSTSYLNRGRRTFRTSALLPWGANIMAVLYQCSTSERYRVMFLVSEYVVRPPWCPSGLCPWSVLQRRLTRSMERHGCPLEFCNNIPYSWVPLKAQEIWAILLIVSTVFFICTLLSAVNRLTK